MGDTAKGAEKNLDWTGCRRCAILKTTDQQNDRTNYTELIELSEKAMFQVSTLQALSLGYTKKS